MYNIYNRKVTMRELKTLFRWMGKYKFGLILILALILLLAYTRTITPQFISYTIDSILLGQESPLPSVFAEQIQKQDSVYGQTFVLITILILFQAARSLLMVIRGRVVAITTENFMYDLRTKTYSHLQRLPFEYFKKNDAGDIIQRCTTDMEVIRTFVTGELVQMTWIFSIIATTLFTMIRVNPLFALVSICCFPLIFLSSYFYFKKIRVVYSSIDENEAQMIDSIKENITGVQVVKAFGSQKFEYDKYIDKSKDYYVNLDKFFGYLSKMHAFSSLFTNMQTFIVVIFGIIFIEKGIITVGVLVLFLSYVKLLNVPIRALARLFSRLGRNFVAIDRVDEILTSKEESYSGVKSDMSGDIEFKNVSFKYADSNENIIDNVSFKIEKGQRVAIIGRTGSGKSTISHLLSRLIDPTSGQILINGVDITTIEKNHLRTNIGVIVQEPYLFSKSIEKNIAIGSDKYDIQEVMQFAQVASIHNDILAFEDGYETSVGERGTTLSGGQKQRIAIARSIITPRKVLVFDDSLSAVDNETDKSIRDALSQIGSATTIAITHRLSSVLDCDKVLVFNQGKLIQCGSIEALRNDTNSYFANLYNKQVGDDNE